MFASLFALSLHSPEQKTKFLEMLGDAFPADSLDIDTSFIKPIPDAPPFKREVHYISFNHDFDNDVDVNVNVDEDAMLMKMLNSCVSDYSMKHSFIQLYI